VTPALVNQSEPRRVAGIATRTTNADEMESSQARIPGLWGEFASQNWAERLGQSGAFGPTMAVYSAYESDVSGSYQILIGREVFSIGAGRRPRCRTSAAGKYLVFKFSGPLPGVAIEGWRTVWPSSNEPTRHSVPTRRTSKPTSNLSASRSGSRSETSMNAVAPITVRIQSLDVLRSDGSKRLVTVAKVSSYTINQPARIEDAR